MSTIKDYSFGTAVYDIRYTPDKFLQMSNDDFEPFRIFIEELDSSQCIFFTNQQVKSRHYDFKKGVYVFSGVINEDDYETIKLLKNSIKNKTYNQYIKNVQIVESTMKSFTEVYVSLDHSFKGYVANFYEYYDDLGTLNFEFVICHRKVLYRDDIFIKRMNNGVLLIGEVKEIARITIPIAKSEKDYKREIKKGKLSNLQVGNTFWAIGGICLATLAIAGAVATGGVATIVITALFAGNTIVSNSYSIYLDYNDRDDEMDLDTLYNNPLKFSMGELMAEIFGEDSRTLGHTGYYVSELVLGGKGLKDFKKGFKIKTLFKKRRIWSERIPGLGRLEGMERVVRWDRVIYNGYQVADGVNGIVINSKGLKNSLKELNKTLLEKDKKVGDKVEKKKGK